MLHYYVIDRERWPRVEVRRARPDFFVLSLRVAKTMHKTIQHTFLQHIHPTDLSGPLLIQRGMI